ncbi:hypothetical protein COY07_02610 [Candidatus Peregrinibacteria bacterium CG_4_10_14_0_2_um_filter_43_11]|nr:MAG: hypothetical protein COY07_02610 [Candidatus Peregrinibacteria bacterium CG_4_10_14_0_2_um_filter_43_11]
MSKSVATPTFIDLQLPQGGVSRHPIRCNGLITRFPELAEGAAAIEEGRLLTQGVLAGVGLQLSSLLHDPITADELIEGRVRFLGVFGHTHDGSSGVTPVNIYPYAPTISFVAGDGSFRHRKSLCAAAPRVLAQVEGNIQPIQPGYFTLSPVEELTD